MAVLRDMLNIGTQANLYNYVITDETVVAVFGNPAWGDVVPKYYYWDVNSTATDDGENVIRPTSIMGAGRYLKIPITQFTGDWSQSNASSLDYIKNKPTIPSAQVSSDWNSVSGVTQILNKPTIPGAIIYYNTAGVQSITKVWAERVTPSTSNGNSINITSAGFSNVVSAVIIAERNTSTAGNSPNVSIKTISASAIVVNIVESNSTTQNVLINLLGGTAAVVNGSPMVFANVSGLILNVTVYGN